MEFTYNLRKSIVDNLKDLLKNYKENVDYIFVDCDKYVALLPFRYDILELLNVAYKQKSKKDRVLLLHCTTLSKAQFNRYFIGRYLKDKELKVFYFLKGAFAREIRKEKNGYLPEFTCWLHNEKSREKYSELFYYFHDNNNSSIYAQYGNNYINSYALAFPIIYKWYSVIWMEYLKHKKTIKYTSPYDEQ